MPRKEREDDVPAYSSIPIEHESGPRAAETGGRETFKSKCSKQIHTSSLPTPLLLYMETLGVHSYVRDGPSIAPMA